MEPPIIFSWAAPLARCWLYGGLALAISLTAAGATAAGGARRAFVGCPGLSAVRGQLYGAMDEALLSLKYDVSLGAAVSDASRGEASRRLVGTRGRAGGE